MKNKENLINLVKYLALMKEELQKAIDEKQTLATTARNLSITPQELNNLKNKPKYFDAIVKKHFVTEKDYYLALYQNQTVEERLYKDILQIDKYKIVDLTQDEKDLVNEALNQLNEREKDVIIQRYADRKSLDEVGYDYNVTRERIRQIEAKAAYKLRAMLYKNLKEKYNNKNYEQEIKSLDPNNSTK
jgi:RNA polymerase sigma factor (sigma-70 family)